MKGYTQRIFFTIIAGASTFLLISSFSGERKKVKVAFKLPYDHTNPVIYDNDYANDEVDWYLMAAASLKNINYKGITTSSAVAPFVPGLVLDTFKKCITNRTRIVQLGRQSGFNFIPDPVQGVIGNLVPPVSG